MATAKPNSESESIAQLEAKVLAKPESNHNNGRQRDSELHERPQLNSTQLNSNQINPTQPNSNQINPTQTNSTRFPRPDEDVAWSGLSVWELFCRFALVPLLGARRRVSFRTASGLGPSRQRAFVVVCRRRGPIGARLGPSTKEPINDNSPGAGDLRVCWRRLRAHPTFDVRHPTLALLGAARHRKWAQQTAQTAQTRRHNTTEHNTTHYNGHNALSAGPFITRSLAEATNLRLPLIGLNAIRINEPQSGELSSWVELA